MTVRSAWAWWLAGILLAGGIIRAQGAREVLEQQRLLELRKQYLTMDQARLRYEQMRDLAASGLVSEAELRSAETAYRQAQVDYQQTFLQLFSELPRVSVVRAVKKIRPDGRRWVALTLRNTAPARELNFGDLGLGGSEIPGPDLLRLRQVRNLSVSLEDASGVVVSKPYEEIVALLPVDGEATLEFELLKDVDAVTVAMVYGGVTDRRLVYLEKDASANLVSIQSARFSQEGDLGSSVTYDLKLERFTSEADVFRLDTVGLPASIERVFTAAADPDTRFNQIRFLEGETVKELALQLHLPELIDSQEWSLDQPLSFWVVVLPAEASAGSDSHGSKLDQALGKVQLELIPRGVGKLEVRIPNLFQEAIRGDVVRFAGTVRNYGTRALRSIRIKVDLPFGWRAETRPPTLAALEPGQELPFEVTVFPPENLELGEYSLRFEAEAFSSNRPVTTEARIARLRIAAAEDWRQPVLLGSILGLVLLATAVIGVRLMRR
ncbi:MAG: hypothetical protein Kow00109_19750 [Acidobacteriota bacterium]